MKKARFPKLIAWMAEEGIGRKGLAADVGLSYPALSRRMSGDKEFKMDEILYIMNKSGKNFEDLFL